MGVSRAAETGLHIGWHDDCCNAAIMSLSVPGSMSQDAAFTEDQKQYLEGFIAGIAAKRSISVPNAAAQATPAPAAAGLAPTADPTAIHIAAQDRAVAAGGT